jgi:hypothetical protein
MNMSRFWHQVATVAVTAGAFLATKLIPATAVIALGPLGIPVAALVDAAITAAAALGIQRSPVLKGFLENLAVKK